MGYVYRIQSTCQKKTIKNEGFSDARLSRFANTNTVSLDDCSRAHSHSLCRASAYKYHRDQRISGSVGSGKAGRMGKASAPQDGLKASVIPRGLRAATACQDAPNEACPSMGSTSRQAGGVPDNPVGHEPSIDAVRVERACTSRQARNHHAHRILLDLPDLLGLAMDERANLSYLRAERSDKVMFSGGFIRARPDSS